MGIVPNFDYDIFISYAHANNQKIAVADRGWVTDLHDVLSDKLLEEMHVRPTIWRDQGGLDGKQVHEGIRDALHGSAVFVAVVSGAYLESEYCCDKELREFAAYKHPAFPLIVRGHKRLVAVVYDAEEETPRARWADTWAPAAELVDAPCATFCLKDAATGERRRYTKPLRSDQDSYWKETDHLVRHLKAILSEMRKGPTGDSAVADLVSSAAVVAQKPPTAWLERRKQQPGGALVYIPHRAADPTALKQELLRRNCDLTLLHHDSAPSVTKRHETNLRYCDGMVVVYGSDGVDWAESLAQEARIAAHQQGRPASIGVLPGASDAPEFGMVSDFIVLLEPSGAGGFKHLDDFLSMLAERRA
jgi:hypothetical protein